MRLTLTLLVCLALSGCAIVYRLPTRQGNVIQQSKLDQLKVGMTKAQVRYVMGTPIATSPFQTSRWNYLGYYKSPRGSVSSRTVSLYFNDDKLTRMAGVNNSSENVAPVAPDKAALQKERKQTELEKSRAAPSPSSGVRTPLPSPVQ